MTLLIVAGLIIVGITLLATYLQNANIVARTDAVDTTLYVSGVIGSLMIVVGIIWLLLAT